MKVGVEMNDELISKAALKKEIQDVVLTVADTPLSNDYTSKLVLKMGELFRKKIDDAPVVDAEPVRHGRWAHLGGDEWCCSHCSDVIHTEGSWEKPTKKYCSECGAKMDGTEDGIERKT